jgi:hypothetical protein
MPEDRKISQLDVISPVVDTDYFPVVDGETGQTKKATVSDLRQAPRIISEELPLDSGDHIHFTIANEPVAVSFRLYRNGARQRSGADYTLTGVNVILVVPLTDGELLLTDYSVRETWQGPTPVSEEVPGDSGDHVNFTIAHLPIAGSFRLFRGGARQQSVSDYTLTGTGLTLVAQLFDGEILLADYSY